MERTQCTLVSASCTTGWFDWLHGELWICQEGLLRRPLGLRATLAHGTGPTVDPVSPATRRLTAADMAQATSAGRGLWLPWDAIARAELRHGILTDSLHLELKDGRRRKLLWMAVDYAYPPLAEALERSIGDRFAGAAPAHDDETEAQGAAETETGGGDEWPLTIVATWTDRGLDLLELRSAMVLFVAGVWATAVVLTIDGHFDSQVAMLAVLGAGALAWQRRRYRPASFEMNLSPRSVRLRETAQARQQVYELARERAGWLTAAESGLDWHDRRLRLTDDAGREIAQFRARPARIQVIPDSAEGKAWVRRNLPYPATATTAPVTALLGAWWPHPGRRASVRGNMSIHRRWAEPSPRGYPAWDRRQRRLYAGAFGAFMLFFVVIGIALPMSLGEGIAYFPLVLGGLAFAVRHVIWERSPPRDEV